MLLCILYVVRYKYIALRFLSVSYVEQMNLVAIFLLVTILHNIYIFGKNVFLSNEGRGRC
jgi:hypothetical protein